MNTRRSLVMQKIIELTEKKRRHLDAYPGTQDRRDSRTWTEILKSIEEELQLLWAERRAELSLSRKERAQKSLEASIVK